MSGRAPAASPRSPSGGGAGGAPPTANPVQAMLDQARTRPQRFEEAMALFGRGRYREAREALHKIAMEDSQSRRYRAAMHTAWGFEHLEAGRAAESRAEFERALALEPDGAEAARGLAKAKEADRKPGILNKLFGK
jgi:Tfp pilus assembly protein PilF